MPDSGNDNIVYEDQNYNYTFLIENTNYTECAAEMHRFYETLGI